jgi:acetyl esterase/lipase
MYLPEAIFPTLLRLIRANRPFRTAQGAHDAIRERALRPAAYGPPARVRSDVSITVDRDGATPVYTVSPTSGGSSGHVIYAHGGGWINTIRSQHWALIFQIAAEAQITVTVPIWRLLPYGDAQEANALMLRLHAALRRSGSFVHLAGDSAGGQIALSAALALRDAGIAGVRTVLIAPALDLTISNPRIPDVLPSDPWLGVDGCRILAEKWAGALPLTDPIVSPLFGDLHDLGPLLIASGTRDILNPDAHLLVDKARAAGVDVTVLERAGAVHDFPLLPTRAGAAARSRIVAALRG